ncbi:hypothetical protein BBP40_008610 [Aspergillus hancockii]|nr:hypothetical protein BBP40_008610 [Aspergillus hancockii]
MVQVPDLIFCSSGGASFDAQSTAEEQRLCLIQRGDTIPAAVSFHDIGPDLQEQTSPFQEAQSYQFHDHASLTNKPNKPVAKARRSLQKLIDLFNASKHTHNPFRLLKPETIYPSIGNRAFVSCPRTPEEGKSSDMTEVFSELRLQFDDGTTSHQYYNCRTSGIKASWFDSRPDGKPISSIHINSGLCLYSKAVLGFGHDHHGKNFSPGGIPPLPATTKPTLYEMEIIARLASAIADWATIIRGAEDPDQSHRCPVSVNLDVPDLQYYWPACELLERNAVDVPYVEAWMALIDQRREQLGQVFLDTIRQLLAQRPVSLGSADCQIKLNLISGTESAIEALKDCIRKHKVPTVEDILSVLRDNSPDGVLWREFLANLNPKHYPTRILDVIRLAYVFKAVKPGLAQKVKDHDGPGSTVIIQIDDVIEWRVFEQARTFLKTYQNQICVLGVFPLPRILMTGEGRACLHVNDPGPRLYHPSGNPDDGTISSWEVMSQCYGSRISGTLERIFREQGLA